MTIEKLEKDIRYLKHRVRQLLSRSSGGSSDHAALSNLSWIASAHTGTASRFAAFDASNVADVSKAVPSGVVVGDTDTQTLTNKTLTSPTVNTPTIDEPVISGTPDAAGELGRDTTQSALNYFDNGQSGTIIKVINVGVGTQSFTNSVITDQDFTSLMTLPANSLFTNKVYRISLLLETVTGTSSATTIVYLKFGSTKVVASASQNSGDGVTRSLVWSCVIIGRAAAGASAATSSAVMFSNVAGGSLNTVDQPVNLATNGTLAITPGITYSATGSTETIELQGWIVEELN